MAGGSVRYLLLCRLNIIRLCSLFGMARGVVCRKLLLTCNMKTKTVSIQAVFDEVALHEQVHLQGWVRQKRVGKHVVFIHLHDGSSFSALQIVMDPKELAVATLKRMTIGASIDVIGKVVASRGAKQRKEVLASAITIIGDAPLDYPLQPKRHTLSFLRSCQHLRIRTRTFHAVFKIRHALSHAIHTFFNDRGFSWLHTPIITSVDAEGAGEVFGVTTAKTDGSASMDFFKKRVFLTVSGQLAGETAAMGLGKIYTFGPTFRAENSNTPRHLAEFWMVEPEMAFYTLPQTIALAEALLQHTVRYVLTHCDEALDFLEQRLLREETQGAKEGGKKLEQVVQPLRERLRAFVERPLTQVTYTQAIELLKEATKTSPDRFVYPITAWGVELQREHENYLTSHFQGGVVVTHYPKAIKAFYMYQNNDGKTVDAMDVLLPGIGEIIGGSARETRLACLQQAMTSFSIDPEQMAWYLDIRRFGSVPHSGFGLGLERLVLFATGMKNIRDVTLFPRTPGHIVC